MSEVQYSFGPFLLYPRRRLLLNAGTPVRLGARAFDLLVALADRSGDIVPKAELLDLVWPSVTVDEVALRVHLHALRKALQLGGLGSTCIISIPGRGYALTAPVQHHLNGDEIVAPPPDRRVANLPSSGKRLIGRGDVVADLQDKLRQRHFLSITGPAGIGKTSVSLQLAETMLGDYPDGLIFVDLAALDDPALLWSAIVSAAGLKNDPENLGQAFVASLLNARALLILDNCEHLVSAAAAVAGEIRRRLPAMDILATSREPLRVGGEWVHRLAPLGCPLKDDAADALTYPAVQLLLERATASNDAFELKGRDIPLAATLCRKLDGIPLSIELVASRVATSGLRAVVAALDDRLLNSMRGSRAAAPRHRTLAAALDWSFDSLTELEKTALMMLSVFPGGMDLQMAVDMVADDELASADAFEILHNLQEKSLLSADVIGDDIEYRLLETTRVYALGKLRDKGIHDRAARNHARALSRFFGAADAEWDLQPAKAWVEKYGRRIVDMRAALSWALSEFGDLDVAAELLVRGGMLWFELGLSTEYHDGLDGFFRRAAKGAKLDPFTEMQLKIGWARSLWITEGASERMLAVGEDAYELAQRLAAPLQIVQTASLLWGRSAATGAFDDDLVSTIHRLAETSTDPVVRFSALRSMALTRHYQGEQAQSWAFHTKVASYDPSIFDRLRRIANLSNGRLTHLSLEARLLWMRGFHDKSMAAAKKGVSYAETLSSAAHMTYFLGFAACPVALWSGDSATAKEWCRRLIDLSARHGFIFSQRLGEIYERVIPRLGLPGGNPGLGLPPDADLQYQFSQLQLVASFHSDFAAPSIVQLSDERDIGWCRSEALRAKALQAGAAEAERLLRLAASIARRQGALSWELRAATSLARLLQREMRSEEAFEFLSGIYSRFTEGFGSLDLIHARLLLEELHEPDVG
ncbi:winged helix-turn-helix domain-containing protein [Phenylobacterium sp.]|uniref:ATP-binding protein n=1 Tax=Phenylobacterium sp. TaxID=1871053 RepID=UPI00121451D5|nr:winged helix-turn-helix domain-containing protein [Phenylobacterium sp.]THD60140.1 MAG: hypothetical protein E8A12_10855 [Phenylobacterium sp.]